MAIALQVQQMLALRSALFPWPIGLGANDDPSPSRYGADGFTEWTVQTIGRMPLTGAGPLLSLAIGSANDASLHLFIRGVHIPPVPHRLQADVDTHMLLMVAGRPDGEGPAGA